MADSDSLAGISSEAQVFTDTSTDNFKLKETVHIDVDGLNFEECAIYEKEVTCDPKVNNKPTYTPPFSPVSEIEEEEESLNQEEFEESDTDIIDIENMNEMKVNKPIKQHQSRVIRVEECTLSDSDEKRESNIQILSSLDSPSHMESSPSPEEPVIIDLDDYSKEPNSENFDDIPPPATPHNITDMDKPVDFLHKDQVPNTISSDFLTDNPPHPNLEINKINTDTFSNGNIFDFDTNAQPHEHEYNANTPKNAQSKELNSNNSSSNWEISSIFSNLKEYQYPFLEDDSNPRGADQASQLSKAKPKQPEAEADSHDSGVFDMSSLGDMRVEHFSLETSMDTPYTSPSRGSMLDASYTSPNRGELRMPSSCVSSFLEPDPQVDNIFMNYQQSTINGAQQHNVNGLMTTANSMSSATMSAAAANAGQFHDNQQPQASAIAPYPYKGGEDMSFFSSDQANYYYNHYSNYENYYNQAMSSNPYQGYNASAQFTSGVNLAGDQLNNSIPAQSGSWYLPPPSTAAIATSTDPVMPDYLNYMTGADPDDEETDDADEFENIQVTFDETVPQQFASPGSQASTSCFSSDGSIMHDYSPSPLSQPPSASSTPGLQDCNKGNNSATDFLNKNNNSATDFLGGYYPTMPPQTMIQTMDINKTYPSPLGGPNNNGGIPTNHNMDPNLIQFGMTPDGKLPFMTMADAMRSRGRSIVKANKPYARPVGRPSKQQQQSMSIQSTKISTSSAKALKGRKKYTRRGVKTEPGAEGGMEGLMEDLLEPQEDGSMRSRSRHNEPLKQQAVDIMLDWFHRNVDNPYPTKADKEMMSREGGISENQVKSWFANKRNRTNNTKPKVQKRAMEEKLLEVCQDLKRNHANPMADNTHIIQQLSGIIQDYQLCKHE